MNPTGKKLISLFLVFSLMMISMNLYAKERRGAKLIVTKKDRQQIEGKLITVKPNSLLLLNNEGKDVSVDIVDIKVIRIVKKSKARLGIIIGAPIGCVAGGLISITREYWHLLIFEAYAAIGVAIGIFIGAITGALIGTDKIIQIEGMTDSEIQRTLDYLRKKARIRDYK